MGPRLLGETTSSMLYAIINGFHIVPIFNFANQVFPPFQNLSFVNNIGQEKLDLILMHYLKQIQEQIIDGDVFPMKGKEKVCNHIMLWLQRFGSFLINYRFDMEMYKTLFQPGY